MNVWWLFLSGLLLLLGVVFIWLGHSPARLDPVVKAWSRRASQLCPGRPLTPEVWLYALLADKKGLPRIDITVPSNLWRGLREEAAGRGRFRLFSRGSGSAQRLLRRAWKHARQGAIRRSELCFGDLWQALEELLSPGSRKLLDRAARAVGLSRWKFATTVLRRVLVSGVAPEYVGLILGPDPIFTNLTARALNGDYRHLYSRSTYVTAIVERILAEGSVLLLGDEGTGKSSLVYSAASELAPLGWTVLELDGAARWSLDTAQLIQGMASTSRQLVIFVDEAHTLPKEFTDLLKPMLAERRLVMILATTSHEWNWDTVLDADRALIRRFTEIHVEEADLEETLAVLGSLCDSFGWVDTQDWSREGFLRKLILWTRRRKPGVNPGNSAGVLVDVYALVPQDCLPVDEDLARVLVRSSRSSLVTPELILNPQGVDPEVVFAGLCSRILGQDPALRELADSLAPYLGGVSDPSRPPLRAILAGPTGVGKTEAARAIADLLGIPILILDMSEFQERHTVARLWGAPPGYVGYEEGGTLTNALQRTPEMLVLLDELEKAHPDVILALLQVFDQGRMTDGRGREVSARNAFFLMTTNLPVWNQLPEGFYSSWSPESRQTELRNRLAWFKQEDGRPIFPPEFLGRLSHVLAFQPLSESVRQEIVRLHLDKLAKRIDQERGVALKFSSRLVAALAGRYWCQDGGVRPVLDAIERTVLVPLAARGFGPSTTVSVDFRGDRVVLV